MKKVFFAIIAILYLGMSSGISMEIHYCMGKFAGIDFLSKEKEKCSKCGMKEKKNGCCRDEHHFIKISDSHKNAYNNIDFSFVSPGITSSFINYEDKNVIKRPVKVFYNSSPPSNTSFDRCILFSVFRI